MFCSMKQWTPFIHYKLIVNRAPLGTQFECIPIPRWCAFLCKTVSVNSFLTVQTEATWSMAMWVLWWGSPAHGTCTVFQRRQTQHLTNLQLQLYGGLGVCVAGFRHVDGRGDEGHFATLADGACLSQDAALKILCWLGTDLSHWCGRYRGGHSPILLDQFPSFF